MELNSVNQNCILLSICIPTINRIDYLKKTIDSIVCQSVFLTTNLVEIIISDNASTDETRKIALAYCEKFPNKVLYYRNEFNILDKNFEKCLSLGRGKFLKLNNDTLFHRDNSLNFILKLIQENYYEKPIIFFPNQKYPNYTETIRIKSLDELIKLTGYKITWIGAFGIWKEHFDKIIDFNRLANSQLIQVDAILRQIPDNQNIIIVNQELFNILHVLKKGGYDIITVFLENLFFVIDYNHRNIIKRKTYNQLKNKIVNDFIFRWFLKTNINNNFSFSYKKIIKRIYHSTKSNRSIFFIFMFKYFFITPIILYNKIKNK